MGALRASELATLESRLSKAMLQKLSEEQERLETEKVFRSNELKQEMSRRLVIYYLINPCHDHVCYIW
jgi:hypothetical protein